MSYIIIGDVHGTSYWKDIVKEYKQTDKDTVIFLGDYVDSFNIKPEQCLENLVDLFEYTCSTPNVHMLIGNHDYHYMKHNSDRYSGYNSNWSKAYYSCFMDNYDLLKLIYIFEYNNSKYICSHAGISNTFLNDKHTSLENINELWKINPNVFGFNYNCVNIYGDNIQQGPLWIRPNSLLIDNLIGYKQIIGHTNLDWNTTFYPNDHEKDSITVVRSESKFGFLVL